MSTPSAVPDVPARRRSVVRAVLLRIAAWGGAVAVVLAWFLDLGRGFHSPSGRQLTHEESTSPDWPHLRGPNYDGTSAETGLADRWPTEGPPVLWRTELGRGYSGFAVAGKRVYTLEQTFTDQRVVALGARRGERLWDSRCGWPYEPAGLYPGPRATPTWHAGRLYFFTPGGLVGCLDATTGQSLWSVNVEERFGTRGTDFGCSCSPLVEDGRVVLPVGGQGAAVVALNTEDGSTVWASGDQPASYCSAFPIRFDGRRQVVAFLQNVLAAYDLHSGRPLWQVPYSFGYDEHSAMPLYQEQGGYLLVSMPFRAGSDLYRIQRREGGDKDDIADRAEDGGPEVTAKLVRHIGELSNDVASSVLVDGHVYGFDLKDMQAKAQRPSRGQFRCIELTTGRVRWSTDRIGHASVIAADGKLLLFNDRGELLLARATPDRYEELGRVQVFNGEICWTAPALADGRVYLRSPTRAACLYVGRPEGMDEAERSAARPAAEAVGVAPVDWTWLVGGEREFPADPLDFWELAAWYACCLPLIALAALAANAARLTRVETARPLIGMAAVVLVGLSLGMLGSPVCNRLAPRFVFTWPVALFAAHQLAIATILWIGGRGGRLAGLALAAVVAFLAVAGAYFDVCRRTNLVPAWVFLLGFLPAWPLAIPAARRMLQGRVLAHVVWLLAAFSTYFWCSAAGALARTLWNRW